MRKEGGWSESLFISNRWCSEKWDYIRRGSFSPLLRSPGGRPACISSPLSHRPSEGPCSDRCCPCCPVKCTCGSISHQEFATSAVERTECVKDWVILTLYRREYSRARITSSRTTRCHDTSSPVVLRDKFTWFVTDSWSSLSTGTGPLWIPLRCTRINYRTMRSTAQHPPACITLRLSQYDPSLFLHVNKSTINQVKFCFGSCASLFFTEQHNTPAITSIMWSF